MILNKIDIEHAQSQGRPENIRGDDIYWLCWDDTFGEMAAFDREAEPGVTAAFMTWGAQVRMTMTIRANRTTSLHDFKY